MIDVFQQRRVDRHARSIGGLVLAHTHAGTHHGIPHLHHDSADIGKVAVDQSGNRDQIRDTAVARSRTSSAMMKASVNLVDGSTIDSKR